MSEQKRIWELQHTTICKVVGMALDLSDLKKVFRKFGLRSPDSHPDEEFVFHSAVVRMCGEENKVSKHVQKLIEKRFLPYAKRLAHQSPEHIADLISHGPDAGGIPLWAILWQVVTGCRSDEESFETTLFGHIHLLEHKLLRDFWNRAGEDRDSQESARGEELSRLSKEIGRLRSACANLERANQCITKRLNESSPSTPVSACAVTAERPGDGRLQELKIQRLKRLLEQSWEERRKLELEYSQAKRQIEALTGELVGRDHPECPPCEESAGDASSCHLRHCLRGRRIAMVGGIDSLDAHYRNLVEQSGGEFCRHDGRCCRGDRKLEQCIKNADLVVCPVSVNSHFGATGVKKMCRKHGVSCCFPDSAGLASLRTILFEHFTSVDRMGNESVRELATPYKGAQ
jgi:hypothetical protein